MRKLVLLLIICLTNIHSNCAAQVTPLNFALVSEAGEGVTDCSIKITGNKTGLIYSYFSMGETWVLKKQIKADPKDDSLLVFINHISYKDTVVRLAIGKASKNSNIVLKLKTNILKDVKIKGPPVWKQGDTTNFRADAFKQGDEKKLKDIILNLPGFNISEKGELLYHNVAISRILIDGDELFADKIKLMLNGFPSRVIDLIQVRQNQSNNKLLKGGGETVLNLTLKKGTFRAAFGDFDAGIGDQGRYQANPVMFSLNKYLKLGYVGNFNSLGNGLGWKELLEVKSPEENEADGLLIRSSSLSLIPNMEEKYYLKNRLFDNRFEANTRLSPKLNIKTSLSIISDRQPQETFSSNNYFNGNSYENRSEHLQSVSKPYFVNVGQSYNYDIDSLNSLQVKAWWFADHGRSSVNTSYLQNDTSSAINNQTINNRNSFNIIGRYTHLNQHKQASTTTAQYNWQQLNQTSSSLSAQWPQIFQLPSPAYSTLYQNAAHHYSSLTVSQSEYFQLGKHRLSASIAFKHKEMQLNPSLNLADTSGKLPAIAPEMFNSVGNYYRNSLSLVTGGKVATAAKKEFSYDLDLGLDNTHYQEAVLRQSVIQPQISVRLAYTPLRSKILNDNITLSYHANPAYFPDIHSIFLPQSTISYERLAFTPRITKAIDINYSGIVSWQDYTTTTSFYAYYSHRFNNPVNITAYSSYLNRTTDSLANKSLNTMMFTISNIIPSLLLNAVVVLDAQMSYNPGLFYYQGELLQSTSTQIALKLSLKKNWNKRYFIILSSNYNYTGNHRPALINSPGINNRLDNFTLGLKQRAVISKYVSAVAEAQQAYNNFRSPNGAHFLLLDTELNWKLKKTPLTMSLRGENLTDRKSYMVAYNDVAGQSISTIPLIGRNYFVALRFELQ